MGIFGSSSSARASEKEAPSYTRGMVPVKLTGVKAIACTPAGSNLIVVRVEISEPRLDGLGCATFTQRAMAVFRAINFALMISVVVRMWIFLKQKAVNYPVGTKSNWQVRKSDGILIRH